MNNREQVVGLNMGAYGFSVIRRAVLQWPTGVPRVSVITRQFSE